MQYRIKVVKFFLLAFIIQITCSKLPGQTNLKNGFQKLFSNWHGIKQPACFRERY